MTLPRILFALVIGFWSLAGAQAQPAFPTNLTVTLVQRGSVSLAWDRAASHTNLASFGVLVGVASGTYNVRQDQPTNTTTATVTNLAPGRYFFAVVARNVAGLDSDPSNEISATVEKPASVPAVRTTQLRGGIEGALYPDGPWVEVLTIPTFAVAAVEQQRFFRMWLEIERGPNLIP